MLEVLDELLIRELRCAVRRSQQRPDVRIDHRHQRIEDRRREQQGARAGAPEREEGERRHGILQQRPPGVEQTPNGQPKQEETRHTTKVVASGSSAKLTSRTPESAKPRRISMMSRRSAVVVGPAGAGSPLTGRPALSGEWRSRKEIASRLHACRLALDRGS